MWECGYQTGNPVLGDSDDVEAAAMYPGERGKFVSAAHESGFIETDPDGVFVIHDLYDHAPEYAKKRMRRLGTAPDGGQTAEETPKARTDGDENGEIDAARRTKPKPKAESLEPIAESLEPKTETESQEQAAAEAAAREAVAAKAKSEDTEPSPADFLIAWNDAAKTFGWQLCVKMAEKRCTALRERRKDHFWRDNWRTAITRAGPIPGLRGENERKWVANIDWFLRPGTVLKIIEGGYDGWGKVGTNGRADPALDMMRKARDAMKAKGVGPCPPN
jgi:hypothetical protein